MHITQEEVLEGIKVVTSAVVPIAVAFGVSGGDVTALSDAAQAWVVASSAVIVTARALAHAIRDRKGGGH